MHKLAQLDHRYVWHPFTQMRDWLREEPIVITAGEGAVLRDVHGREYIDANSSIWTNLHGHNHPSINAAITTQLGKIAHSSALGLANEPSPLLAGRLVKLAALRRRGMGNPKLAKVFFSDDGSTAVEVALKLAHEYARRVKGVPKPRFLSLAGAYHGDTIGAVSLGHIDLFHKAYGGLLFRSDKVAAPFCYRCPANRAKPERADAREYRRCNWECVTRVERKFERATKTGRRYDAFVFEPLMQGAAGMIPQPDGWLRRVASMARSHGALLVADEVMTGFGRTGSTLFACHREGVQPDFMALAKGLTGGYLPMAATLTTEAVFNAFLGNYSEFKTFFHGHSFTGNQLGSAAALASLGLLANSAAARRLLEQAMASESQALWKLPNIGDIRQTGLVMGVELVRDWRTRQPFALEERAGIRVCRQMAEFGVLTRPIGNVIVIMPPYCTSPDQVKQIMQALRLSIEGALGTDARRRR